MDQEQMEAVLDANVGKQAMRVLLATKCGYLDIYGIQIRTGYKRHEVLEALEALRNFRNNAKALSINNNILLRSAAEKAQDSETPPERLLSHLADTLGLPVSAMSRSDHAGVKESYLFAYEYFQRDADRAFWAVWDWIGLDAPTWKHVRYHGKFLLGGVKKYVPKIPTKTKMMAAEELQLGKRMRYNPNKRKWELTNDRIK